MHSPLCLTYAAPAQRARLERVDMLAAEVSPDSCNSAMRPSRCSEPASVACSF